MASTNTSISIVFGADFDATASDMLVSALSKLVPGFAVVRRESIRAALAQDEQPVLVVIERPGSSLARRLSPDAVPAEALKDWVQWAADLLGEQRRARRRVTLVEAQALLCPTDAVREILARRLAAELAKPGPGAGAISEADALHLLAAELLLTDSVSAPLVEELRVVTLGGDRPLQTEAVVGAALSSWNSLVSETVDLRTSQVQIQDRIDQLNLNSTQLEEGRNALESSLAEALGIAVDRAAALETANAALEKAGRDAEQLNAALAVVQKEREELIRTTDKMTVVEQNLNKKSSEVSKLTKQLNGRTQEIEALQKAALRNSEELDLLRETLSSQHQEADSLAHDQKKLLQAYTTLEQQAVGLERQAEDRQRQIEERNALFAEVFVVNAQSLDETARSLEETSQRLMETTQSAEALQAELTAVYASSSWKATGPLRAARSKITPPNPGKPKRK